MDILGPRGPLIDNTLPCVTTNTQIRVVFQSKAQISTRMNFIDMGPFENPLVTHGNVGFNVSGPPGQQRFKQESINMQTDGRTLPNVLSPLLRGR